MASEREKEIVKASSIGIGANVLLAGFKAGIGLLSGSIAVVLDAVNNVSDAFSSIITIVGAKLASRRPTRNHPLGYGRIEYISATLIAFIVLLAGVAAFKESVKAIINGNETEYDVWSFVVMAIAVLVKIVLGRYTQKVGEQVQSQSLVASGTDAIFDAVVTTSTIVSAMIMVIWQVNIDGWLGAAISIVIIKAGIDLIRNTMNDLLGCRMSAETTKKLKSMITKYPGVYGAYDMILNNYGPEYNIGSVNIEVPAEMNAEEIHRLSRRIQNDIYLQEGVNLTFGIYSVRDDEDTKAKRQAVVSALKEEKDVLQIHAFYIDEETKTTYFDAVITFDVKDLAAYRKHLTTLSENAIPGYKVTIQVEYDVSD